MKPSKTLLIAVIIIVVLLVLAYLITSSNKKKLASSITNAPAPKADITGRHIAASNIGTDYTELVNGKAKWLWGGRNNCLGEYTKILTGANSGWCVLTSEFNRSVPPDRSLAQGKKWCCTQFKANGDCELWEQKDLSSPCATTA